VGSSQTDFGRVKQPDKEMHSATEHSDASYRHLSIGGISLRITASEPSGVAIHAQHEPFIVASGRADINLDVRCLPSLLPSSQQALFDSGSTWRVCEHGNDLCFDFGYPLDDQAPAKRLFVDRPCRNAALQLNSDFLSRFSGEIPPLAYPIDELLIMHRLNQERAIELHGTGIVRANGVANLFVGHSGAGKSTTTRLWTSREEVEVLSDDRIIVRYDDGRDGPAGPTQMRMYGTPWHGEAMFASPNSAPLTRIFVLEHGHGNVITCLSRSEAVGELFARAFVPFHRHEYLENALSFLEQLVSSVPCYRYSFEPDERAVEKIQQFND
jgi:hypothetical protein